MQSREGEEARARTTAPVAAEPIEDTTNGCAEFEVGPVAGNLRGAQTAAGATAHSRSSLGASRVSRTQPLRSLTRRRAPGPS